MKKIIVILIIGIVSLSIIFAYNKTLKKKISAQYFIYSKYHKTYVVEFTPEGNPNYVCVGVFGGNGRGISCIPKGK